jgi:hypothetical protein
MMRNFSQLCHKCLAASVLVLVLSCAAFAGDMQYPGVTSQPPSTTGDIQYPNVASSSATVSGDIQYPAATESTWTETALDLLQGVLSLF